MNNESMANEYLEVLTVSIFLSRNLNLNKFLIILRLISLTKQLFQGTVQASQHQVEFVQLSEKNLLNYNDEDDEEEKK